MLQMATNVKDAIYSTLDALDRFAPGEFLTITRLDSGAGETTIPAATVRRVLVDLVREVKRHTPAGASLELATGRTSLSIEKVWPGIDPGDYLTVSITVRTPADVAPRFDLLKMLVIAQSGGAHLTVMAQKGGFTTFRVLMPQGEHAGCAHPQRPGGEKTIFLAGDHLRDRSSLRTLLLEQGYVVIEPGSHRPVHRIFTTLGHSIDLVVLHSASGTMDTFLPDWLASSPGVPIVVSTVQPHDSSCGEKLLSKIRALLHKPYSRHSIMVVDEDESMRRMVAAVLDTAGYEVSEARDGREALRLIAKRKPDALLTEMVLPEADGLQLIQALRKSGQDTKIIAVSGSPRADTYLWVARSLGADVVLPKPLWVEDLLQNIRNLLKESLVNRLHYVSHDC